ncbi:TPA: hypothetical protein ACG4O9_001467 [Stenotrophomonas maltophilia]
MRTALPLLVGVALTLAGCMPGATPAVQTVERHAPRPGVDVRLSAVDADGKGTQALRRRRRADPSSFRLLLRPAGQLWHHTTVWQGETLALREPPIADSADIADVRYVLDAGQEPGLQIRYRPEARQRIHDGTAALVGQRAAISVNGRVLMVATVKGPFGESMMLSGLPSVAEAQALARHITGK